MRYTRETKRFLKAVGKKLCSLRKEQKKEVESVAKAMKISLALLIRIEKGDYDIRLDLLRKLCEYYGTTSLDLFRHVESELGLN